MANETVAEKAATRRERRQVAQLIATTVEVICPACGESQPNPDNGAFPWTFDEVKNAAVRPCVACETPLRIVVSNRVQFNPEAR